MSLLASETLHFWVMSSATRRAEAAGELDCALAAEIADEVDLIAKYTNSKKLRFYCERLIARCRRTMAA